MATRNSERFLVAFNRIEKALEKMTGSSTYVSFFKLIDFAKKKNAIIRHFEDDLREYGDLRNAIVHHRTAVEYAIAEPHDEVVEKIEQIDRTLTAPPVAGEQFRRRVHIFSPADSLAHALRTAGKKRDFQIPVYDRGEFRGLISPSGLMEYLAETVSDDVISREMTTLSDILRHIQTGRSYEFISANLSIYAAEEMFSEAVVKGRRLDALLITENGGREEKLLGIITPWDLMKIE
ncbi:CBS domain-containing protein [Bhargavaea beijingensis]|uniref:CBS domain-containing protein n=1 Tax=Bhargavaea beijingensis TaxID=426756 RepID=A0A1G6YM04_9BACL|nr:CBS domain-containing protein [Bhargavaea beijingensis]RSK36685.1 CBS domain-containing protein [Bhargavaea beijingensis]SDD91439.1 CBS domain-containing protein [Bhargavaea beijingensis]